MVGKEALPTSIFTAAPFLQALQTKFCTIFGTLQL